MAINPYINLTTFAAEQNLVESVTIELIQGVGQDCLYVPRNALNIDRVFGEDPSSFFNSYYTIEMYIQSYKGFEGTDVITQFGIEIKDKISLLMSRKRFRDIVTAAVPTITRPREGDLIYFPLSKSLFEINFVEHENPMYPLGKLYTYQITAELFTGGTFAPLNNIIGNSAGINKILENEADTLYNFDPNDPNTGCAS
jgi:hypothetical protein